jgi:hypothetical protein
MPQNISVVVIDSDTDLINSIVKYEDRKLSLRGKRSNLAFAFRIALVEKASQ